MSHNAASIVPWLANTQIAHTSNEACKRCEHNQSLDFNLVGGADKKIFAPLIVELTSMHKVVQLKEYISVALPSHIDEEHLQHASKRKLMTLSRAYHSYASSVPQEIIAIWGG